MARDDGREQSVSLGVLDQAELRLGLDFANTVEWHAGPSPEERLTSYDAAVRWARRAGILDDALAEGLLVLARARAAEVQGALDRIIALREAVYRIFSAVAHDREPDHADIHTLHAELGEALVHLRVAAAPCPGGTQGFGEDHGADAGPECGHRFVWTWAGMDDQLVSILWPVARAAASLLTSPQLARVRECADDACGWLFLDHSKNGSRRWCDMSDCGNRAKARRYRARKKSETA